MPTITETSKQAQEQVLSAVQQSQKAVVEAVGAWAKAVEKAIPDLPNAPKGVDVPKPAEVVDNAFAYAEKLLAAQKDFAKNLLKAAGPVLDKAPESRSTASGSKK
jgi:hypothetical protein